MSDLLKRIMDFAKATDAPEDSFLMGRFSLEGPDQIRSVIDGLTLSLISYCYHSHPRGENVYAVMQELERAEPGSAKAVELERRAEEAAALQIPFVVTLNRLLEEYYYLRRSLESLAADRTKGSGL